MPKFFNAVAFTNSGMGNIENRLQNFSQKIVNSEVGKVCHPLREDTIPILNDNMETSYEVTYVNQEEGVEIENE